MNESIHIDNVPNVTNIYLQVCAVALRFVEFGLVWLLVPMPHHYFFSMSIQLAM